MRQDLPGNTCVVGVGGGSAAGKSAVVAEIVRRLPPGAAANLPHDAYYHDLSDLERADRFAVNVDHPDSLDTERFLRDLHALRDGVDVRVPVYDFVSRTRHGETRVLTHAPIIIVEGILVLSDPRLRALMDLKVFVDAPEDERLARRIARDVTHRGGTPESVTADHLARVQPMHLRFVEPGRAFADFVVLNDDPGPAPIDALLAPLLRWIAEGPREGGGDSPAGP